MTFQDVSLNGIARQQLKGSNPQLMARWREGNSNITVRYY